MKAKGMINEALAKEAELREQLLKYENINTSMLVQDKKTGERQW